METVVETITVISVLIWFYSSQQHIEGPATEGVDIGNQKYFEDKFHVFF